MHRKGLTLLELVIVMVILVALAGIVVPMLPSMVSRAHTAAHATNCVELNKVVEAYNMINRGYPDYLDNLVSGNGILPNMPGDTPTQKNEPSGGWQDWCGGELQPGSLTVAGSSILPALQAAGIYNVLTPDVTATGSQALLDSPYGSAVTGNPQVSTALTPLAAGTAVAVLTTGAAGRLYNDSTAPQGAYVVFGVGPGSAIVGHGIPEAPVHYADDPGDLGNPQLTYARFGLVFRVINAAGTPLDTAQLVGAVAFHPDHVSNGDAGIAEATSLNH